MDTSDEKNRAFPGGFEHIQEQLFDTTKHVEQLDDQIKNIPKEKGPTLEYRPPHFLGRVIPGSRDKTRLGLEEKQHQIKSDMLAKTEAETRDATGQSGRIVRDRVREQLFPNPYRTLSREDRSDQKSVSKEIEQSQDYMDAMLTPKEIVSEEATLPRQDTPEKTDMSMSARFSMSLNFTKATSPTDPGRSSGPSQSREKDQDMDRD